MLEDKLEELDQLLFIHAIPRLENSPLYTILRIKLPGKVIIENGSHEQKKKMHARDFYLETLIRTFNRLILNCTRETNISHIASMLIAETNYLLNVPSWAPFQQFKMTTEGRYHIDVKFILESEVHNWLILLQEEGKLPGTYDRLLGLYTGNVIK